MHTEFHRCLVCPSQCGLYSFRAQNKVDVLVLLTPALAGESPTCTLYMGIHIPQHARSKHQTQFAKLSSEF